MPTVRVFIVIPLPSPRFSYWNKSIHVSCSPVLILASHICFYLSCSNARHWGAYCLIGRADIISVGRVKMQAVASDEWSISSIDASQILDAIGPDSCESYYFGRRGEKGGWNGIVMLWEFKSDICFLCMHHLEFWVRGLCFVSDHRRAVKL